MIDSHCHLEYIEDAEAVVKEARNKMSAIVTSVPDPKDFDRIMALQEKHKGFVFVAAGFHPELTGKYKDEELEVYIEKLRENSGNIVSIGEIGLDYSWVRNSKGQEKSKEIFVRFLELAKELALPITIHSRNGQGNDGANDGIGDVIKILKEQKAKNVMMHCFSGSEENLCECLAESWLISFATIIARSKKHQRLAAATPLEQMLLETDAPWLDPEPKGSRELTNRPWKIERSAEIIAELKGETKEEILHKTAKNAVKLFRLPIKI